MNQGTFYDRCSDTWDIRGSTDQIWKVGNSNMSSIVLSMTGTWTGQTYELQYWYFPTNEITFSYLFQGIATGALTYPNGTVAIGSTASFDTLSGFHQFGDSFLLSNPLFSLVTQWRHVNPHCISSVYLQF